MENHPASKVSGPLGDSGAERRKRWFEPATVILMALTTIATTWCSYESSRWSGESSGFQNHTNELQRQALALHFESSQVEAVHANAFMAMINARLSGNEKLADFYVSRFGESSRRPTRNGLR